MSAALRILVVDDEPRGVELLVRALRSLGEVTGAQSGEEGWELIQRQPFDVVISDQRMPGMTGVELLRQVAERDELVGRVLLTGFADLNDTVDAINRGRVHAYLSKPCPPEQVQSTVRSVADRVTLARQNLELVEQLQGKNRELRETFDSLREAKDLAEAASRAKSDFLANISHEIRTPMTAILGFAEVLTEEPSADDRDQAIQAIQRNGDHLMRLINDILELARTESGELRLEREPVSLVGLLADLREFAAPEATNKGFGLALEVDSACPETIHTDAIRLRQILTNLLENSIRFTTKGSITLAVRPVDGGLEFSVRDTGIGMTREQQLQVFRPFTQVDASASRQAGGVGLGLTICRRLAEVLGGTIAVESRPGRGTTFRVTLPLDVSAANEERARPAAAAPSAGALPEGLRILVAEDSPDNQRLVSMLLRKAGAEVEVAENGRIAVDVAGAALAEGEPFALILMDMQMPELDGYEATRALRDQGYSGPIVALTAHAMDGHREECLAAGCDDYLTKPIQRGQMLEIVARYATPDKES